MVIFMIVASVSYPGESKHVKWFLVAFHGHEPNLSSQGLSWI